MKKTIAFVCLAVMTLISIPFVSAQTSTGFRGQSINGSTGLFAIPTGRIGWEDRGNFAVDFGYRAIINNDRGTAHIPAVTFSLFKWVELSSALDIQPNVYGNQDNNDLIFGLKFKLPSSRTTAIALGANMQLINFDNQNHNYNAYQPYLAITYSGNFFTMPADTTIVFGKTFYSGQNNNSNIDFGMGFDIIMFPDVFGNTVHWIIDFANFSYSDNAWPNYSLYQSGPAWHRGALNMGFRIDLSTIPAFNKYKFLIDFIFNDLFDDGQRSFSVGAVFGFSP